MKKKKANWNIIDYNTMHWMIFCPLRLQGGGRIWGSKSLKNNEIMENFMSVSMWTRVRDKSMCWGMVNVFKSCRAQCHHELSLMVFLFTVFILFCRFRIILFVFSTFYQCFKLSIGMNFFLILLVLSILCGHRMSVS